MKIEFEKSTICLSEITYDHLIVGIYYGNPIMWRLIDDELNKNAFVKLNCGFVTGEPTIKSSRLEHCLTGLQDDSNVKIACFHQKDWDKALQWLIDNKKKLNEHQKSKSKKVG